MGSGHETSIAIMKYSSTPNSRESLVSSEYRHPQIGVCPYFSENVHPYTIFAVNTCCIYTSNCHSNLAACHLLVLFDRFVLVENGGIG